MSPAKPSPPELAMLPRFALAALGWGILLLLGPGGAHGPDPHPAALIGVAVLAYAVGRPGPRSFLVEWMVAALAAALLLDWIRYVFGPALIICGLIYGFHGALFGSILKRLVLKSSWAVAVPIAWCVMESIRFLVPVPLGMRWIQLGHYAIDQGAIVGAARVIGPTGLSFVLAAIAGLLLDSVLKRATVRSVCAGLSPLALAWILAAQTSLPANVPGPRVLLIQPGVSQARKQRPLDPLELHQQQVDLTRSALEQSDGPAPDVVCWGETMLGIPLVGDTLAEAVRMGALGEVSLPGISLPPERLPQAVANWKAMETHLVGQRLLGSGPERILPPGCAFVCGAEVLVLFEGEVRRINAVCSWSPTGKRMSICPKLELVPGGETLYGLEDVQAARDVVLEVAGYLPNLLAGDQTGVFEIPGVAGEAWKATGTVCYDNSFLHPYTDPLARGEAIDLHVICSNEAWYLDSWEMDQMVCMSRMIAIATARPLIRATNSGVSCVLDASGHELGRIRKDGLDRQVAGFLSIEVPIQPKTASVTLFCRVRSYIPWLFILLAALVWKGSRGSGGYHRDY
jgi:apolipoprotein N-acyltransferase